MIVMTLYHSIAQYSTVTAITVSIAIIVLII